MKMMDVEINEFSKEPKNGVLARVRSRWRSIFSKKNSAIKLRDYNRMPIDAYMMPENDMQIVGTIVAQATVEPFQLPDGEGVTLIQETQRFSERQTVLPSEAGNSKDLMRPGTSQLHRFSSGDISMIHQMIEEINDIKNVQEFNICGVTITEEEDDETGTLRAHIKPGPGTLIDQQKLFLKKCLDNVDNRPSNMIYSTSGWPLPSFEGLLKHILKRPDHTTSSFLRIELSDCIPSLEYLFTFIDEYTSARGMKVDSNYVYATVHAKKTSKNKKLRGPIEKFIEIEQMVRQTKVSYVTDFTVTCSDKPHVRVIVRFYNFKTSKKESNGKRREVGITVQIDQLTGYNDFNDGVKEEDISCSLPSIESLIDEDTQESAEDETEYYDIDGDSTDTRSYAEMFPLLTDLLKKSNIRMSDTFTDLSFDESTFHCCDSTFGKDDEEEQDEDDDLSTSDSLSDCVPITFKKIMEA